mgnify:CR=1 FL=1
MPNNTIQIDLDLPSERQSVLDMLDNKNQAANRVNNLPFI